MSMELNKVIIAGNLTRNPELKSLPSGLSVCSMGLASNRKYTKKGEDETQEETCFVDVTVWGRQGEVCAEYLSTGTGVVVEGRLKFDKWEDNENNQRSKLSIVADRVHFFPKGKKEGTPTEAKSLSAEEVPF